MPQTQSKTQAKAETNGNQNGNEKSKLSLSSLLKTKKAFYFTPKYEGNEFVPLIQKFMLSPDEITTYQLNLGTDYNLFLSRQAAHLYLAIKAKEEDSAAWGMEGDPATFIEEFEKNTKINIKKELSPGAILSVLKQESTTESKFTLEARQKAVTAINGNMDLVVGYRQERVRLKRHSIYAKAYTMIFHRYDGKELDFSDYTFDDFQDTVNRCEIPFPIVYIISEFYDAEFSSNDVPDFKPEKLSQFDIQTDI